MILVVRARATHVDGSGIVDVDLRPGVQVGFATKADGYYPAKPVMHAIVRTRHSKRLPYFREPLCGAPIKRLRVDGFGWQRVTCTYCLRWNKWDDG